MTKQTDKVQRSVVPRRNETIKPPATLPSPTEDKVTNPGLASEDRQRLPADSTNAPGEPA